MHCKFKCTQRIISGVYHRPPQTNWPEFKSMKRTWRKLQTQQTDSTHTRVLAKHSPGSNNSDDDDDANGISGTNRKKAFHSELIWKITAIEFVFLVSVFAHFFLHYSLFRLPESISSLCVCVCVSNAGALKVENRENIFRFAQHLFYFPVLTSDFIFIYFFVICCYCIPSRSPALSSVFNCRRLCSLEGTLFRSGFVSIEFLWTAKEKQKMWPGCLTSPLLCLVSTPIFYTLFPKQKISVKL